MTRREYFSVRTGKHPSAGRLDLLGLKRLLLALFRQFQNDDFFQESFGFTCVDSGFIAGYAGEDVEAFFFRKLRKQNLWPIDDNIEHYSEDDLFDVIELLFDCISKGVEGNYHSWNQCGMHYSTFNKQTGQNEFRSQINEILADYSSGFSLTVQGEIVGLAPLGLVDLEEAPSPPGDPVAIHARIEAARNKFRRRGSSFEERRDAIRDLADVLEYLRPLAKKTLNSKDEADLFNLANNFGIRHHNSEQKTSYDSAIWLSWMFYYYLATIHALTRLIQKHATDPIGKSS